MNGDAAMKRRPTVFSNFSLACVDVALLHLSIVLAFGMRSEFGFFQSLEIANLQSYFELAPWISLIMIMVFFYMDLYDTGNRKKYSNFCYSIVISIVIMNVIILALAFWNRNFAFPRSVIVLSGILQCLFIMSYRYGIWLLVRKLHGRRSVLIVTNNERSGMQLASKILQHAEGWFSVKHMVSPEVLLADASIVQDVDIVLIGFDISSENTKQCMDIAIRLGKEVMVVPDSYHIFLHHSYTQQIADTIVLSVQQSFLTRRQQHLKRMFDLTLSSILLTVSLPIMAVIWLLIKSTSQGPAVFRQERVGHLGRPFIIYKFRSMVHNAEEKTGPILARDRDSRITPIGRIIRSTRLDELPQLFNVLKGEMSLVGPRPERACFTQEYEVKIRDYMHRISVKPGITGLAQVMSNYTTTMEDKVRFDLLYGHNYSLLLDIKILFQTMRIVFQRDSVRGVVDAEPDSRAYGRLGLGEMNFPVAKTESNLE
jgi:exopolysaccharide biosynthesis polyprenyl glycosylphosphotransferase